MRVTAFILGCVFMAALASSAHGAFVVVDDFDGLTLGDLGSQNGWTTNNTNIDVVVDPTDASNQILQFNSNADNGITYKSILIPNSSTAATIFFRTRRTGTVNMSWGTSDDAVPTVNFDNYETQFNIQDGSTSDLRVRNGLNAEIVETFATNTWYNTWMVINNSANTYEVYMQGGALGSVTQLDNDAFQTTFNFRNGLVNGNDLINLLLRAGGNQNSNFMFDDIYIDTSGENLANPVPEPATFILAGIAGLGMLCLRRRKQ